MFINCQDHGVPGIKQASVIFEMFVIFSCWSRIWPAVHQTHFPSSLSIQLDYVLQISILFGLAMGCLGQWTVAGKVDTTSRPGPPKLPLVFPQDAAGWSGFGNHGMKMAASPPAQAPGWFCMEWITFITDWTAYEWEINWHCVKSAISRSICYSG